MKKVLFIFVSILLANCIFAQSSKCPKIYREDKTLCTDPADYYQWYYDGVAIPGATAQTFTPIFKGNYTVKVFYKTPAVLYIPTNFATLRGVVLDNHLIPIKGASVNVGNVKVTTASDGSFELKVNADAPRVVVEASYNKGQLPLANGLQPTVYYTLQQGLLKGQTYTQFILKPRNRIAIFNSNSGGTASMASCQVEFPDSCLVNASTGQPYYGEVHIYGHSATPSDHDFATQIPGGDMLAKDKNGADKILYSYGFFTLEIDDKDGNKLQLAANKQATIYMDIAAVQKGTAPATIPLWFYDDKQGFWVEDGEAKLQNGQYVGTVKHFTSWNCDKPEDRATVKGKVKDCKGYAEGVTVRIGQTLTNSDINGNYTRYVPAKLKYDISSSDTTLNMQAQEPESEHNAAEITSSNIVDGYAIAQKDKIKVRVYARNRPLKYSLNGTNYQEADSFFINEPNNEQFITIQDQRSCSKTIKVITPTVQDNCVMLDSATLDNVEWYGSLEKAIAATSQVSKLNIQYMAYITFPMEIVEYFSCIQNLYLQYIQLTSLPAEIENLKHLKELGLSYNQLTSLPAQIGNLKNLKQLYLNDNKLTNLPSEIGNLKNLTDLWLYSNKLTALPVEIGNIKHLTRLRLDDNKLKHLPSEISNLKNLTTLEFSYNQLTSLPTEIENLKLLTNLYLNRNELTSLPAEIGNLKHLKKLEFLGNKLTSLPTQIGNLTNLTNLWLGEHYSKTGNFITELPKEIGNLTKLGYLDGSYNKLTTLPEEIKHLKDNLKELHLEGNNFSDTERAKIKGWLPNTNIYW